MDKTFLHVTHIRVIILLHMFLDKAREVLGEKHPVTLVFEDQHINDFNALFTQVQGVYEYILCLVHVP